MLTEEWKYENTAPLNNKKWLSPFAPEEKLPLFNLFPNMDNIKKHFTYEFNRL